MILSVIIPTYNEEKALPGILNDLKAQTDKDFEVIVSDSSEDRTPEVAQAAGAKVVRVEKIGPSTNRNGGAMAAAGDMLVFLDADTHVSKDFIKSIKNEIQRKQIEIGMVQFQFDSRHPSDQGLGFIMNASTRLLQWIRPFTHGFSIVCSKKLFENLQGFNESLKVAEDVDFGYRGSKKGKYRVLTSTKVFISPRRLEEEGRMRLVMKWIKTSLLTLLGKEIRHDDSSIEYTYGKHEQ